MIDAINLLVRLADDYKLVQAEFLSKPYEESDLKGFDKKYDKWKKQVDKVIFQSNFLKLISKEQVSSTNK
jgi:hypothetical protein